VCDNSADIAAVERLLRTYPRTRPPLSPAHEASYVEHYRANRSGEGISRIVMQLEAWMHREVARTTAETILELGAGNLNHVPYHPSARVYDVVEPFRELWEDSPHRRAVRSIFGDIAEVPEQSAYDTILSVAVLEHLTDLPTVIARSALLLRQGGELRAAFPSEGGFLWGLSWRTTTGAAYRLKRGLNYSAIMRHEHVNSAREILEILGYFFTQVEVTRFPSPWHHFSFYTAASATLPRLDRCRQWRVRQAEATP
jgi:SAM-dependent methyltransferase